MTSTIKTYQRAIWSLLGITLVLTVAGQAVAQKALVKPTVSKASTKLATKPAPKPLFGDPVFDGAADLVIIWNKQAQKWWMFYTNRRATDTTARGVTWVHGTRIGIAESADGGTT